MVEPQLSWLAIDHHLFIFDDFAALRLHDGTHHAAGSLPLVPVLSTDQSGLPDVAADLSGQELPLIASHRVLSNADVHAPRHQYPIAFVVDLLHLEVELERVISTEIRRVRLVATILPHLLFHGAKTASELLLTFGLFADL